MRAIRTLLAFIVFALLCADHAAAQTSLSWDSLPHMPIGRIGAAGIAVDEKIYLIGGNAQNEGSVASVSEYSVNTGVWENKSPIPTPRTFVAGALGPDGRIYVVGGVENGVILNTVEIYDPSTDSWTTAAPMPTPRYDLAAVFGSNGKLYAIGGSTNPASTTTGIVEEYDPLSNTWVMKNSLNLARYGLGAALGNNGLLYVAGGSPQRAIEEYNPILDTWTIKAVPFFAHIHSDLLSATNGKLYLIGGGGGPRVEEYDVSSDMWTILDNPIPTPRQRLAAVHATDGHIYTFGGQPDFPNTAQPIEITQVTVEKASIDDGAMPSMIAINPTADTYVRSGHANQNEGSSPFMRIQASGNNRALVRFDQSEIQSAIGNSTILSATLRLTITHNGNNWGANGRNIDIHRLTSDWTEGNGTESDRGLGEGATWNCAIDNLIENQTKGCNGITEWEMGQPNNPAVHPWIETATATQMITNNQTGTVEFDVMTDIEEFHSGNINNYGWIVKKANEGQAGMVSFGTKESQFSPELIITYQQ